MTVPGYSAMEHSMRWLSLLFATMVALPAHAAEPDFSTSSATFDPPLVVAGDIVRYTVARPPQSRAAADTAANEDEWIPGQLLGAIIPQGERTWFFKLIGPLDDVKPQLEPFLAFMKSVRLTEKDPEWSLPEGWKQLPGSDERFATVKIPVGKEPLALTVTGFGSAMAKVPARASRAFQRRACGRSLKSQVGPPCTEAWIASAPMSCTAKGLMLTARQAAIKAGKHVFMEKPCCVDAAGFRILMETNKLADEKGLKVGVGFQRRHTPPYMETIKRLHDGAIGKLMVLRGYWNGDGIWVRRHKELATVLGHEPTEMEYQINNWYHFCWLSGDNICEQHIHNLDVCNWAKDAHPVEANGMGGCSVRYSGENKGVGQIFDHHFVEFTYADGTKLYSQCRHIPGTWINVSEAASGTQGESNCAGWIKGKGEWHFKGKNVNSMVQEHADLINAIGKNEKYNEGYHGATSSMTAVLGRMATYSGQVVRWEDAVAKGTTEFPATLAWDAKAPVEPDKDGNYPIPVPGVYKPYA